MKPILLAASLALSVLTGCNNSSSTTEVKKDSLDSVASEAKSRLDSSAKAEKAGIDTARKQEKTAIDAAVDRKERALDRRDSLHRADSIKHRGK